MALIHHQAKLITKIQNLFETLPFFQHNHFLTSKKIPKIFKKKVRDAVKKYYGETLHSKDDLKSSCCTTAAKAPEQIQEIVKNDVPEEILNRYYGCGGCVPLGIQGLNILDLGSGSG